MRQIWTLAIVLGTAPGIVWAQDDAPDPPVTEAPDAAPAEEPDAAPAEEPATEPPDPPTPAEPDPSETTTDEEVAITATAAEEEAVGRKPVDPDRLLVLLLPLAPKRVSEALVETVDDLIASDLASRSQYKVTTIADLNALFEAERLKDLAGCEDVACSAEIGGAIGADRILTGSVGRIDETYVITLRWLDAVYAEPLAVISEPVRGGEVGIPRATKRALHQLLDETAGDDELARERKRAPTFATVEASVGLGLRDGPEPYDTGFNGTLRLAWGGRPKGVSTRFYLIGGLGWSRFNGTTLGPNGRVEYSRMLLTPFVELRAAQPIALGNRLRLYASAGLGVSFESNSAEQDGGLSIDGSARYAELRGAAGLWYRWSYLSSFFAHYRLRGMLPGDGADGISELVEIGSTAEGYLSHEFEIGWAVHF